MMEASQGSRAQNSRHLVDKKVAGFSKPPPCKGDSHTCKDKLSSLVLSIG